MRWSAVFPPSIPTALRQPFMRGLALYVVLPNLALFALGQFIFLLRPLVNVDYLLLWAASGRLSRRVVAMLYVLLVLLDFALSVESIYAFSTADMLLNVHYLPALDPAHVYAIAGVLLLLVAAVAKFARGDRVSMEAKSAPRHTRMAILAGLSAAGIAAAANGLDVWTHPYDPTKTVRVAGSRVLEVAESGMALAFGSEWTSRLYSEADWRGRVLLRDLSRAPASQPPYNLVLIVVESDGLLKNASDKAAVLEPLTGAEVAKRYSVTRGTLPFSGPTVSGELRALCGIRASPVAVDSAEALPECLPSRLRKRGYETLSYHANSAAFFERAQWYPKLGFDLSYFTEELTFKSGGTLSTCGVLIRGPCDADMAGIVRNELKRPSPRKKFIYWLTLSSHLPVDTLLARDAHFDCGSTETLKDEPGPCGLERILHQLHREIAAIALDPALPPTRFVLVGDHAPVFAELSERALYDYERVPFVDLVPLGDPSGPAE